MTRETFHLELITPCFCAGADQAKAEIRAASIRGQLRWWFRVLGGTPEAEASIFGAAAGDEGTASQMQVRVTNFIHGPVWQPPGFSPNDSEAYVWHFARESGKPSGAGRNVAGPRWSKDGAIAPDSTFDLQILSRARLPERFHQAVNAFLVLGSLGLRSTRGLGSFHCAQAPQLADIRATLEKAGFAIRERSVQSAFGSYTEVIKDYAAWLRHDFRKQHKAARPSPLGGISPRQTSAIRFRPLKLAQGSFTWVAYEAPHKRVLGSQSRTPQPLLSTRTLSGPAPQPAPRRR